MPQLELETTETHPHIKWCAQPNSLTHAPNSPPAPWHQATDDQPTHSCPRRLTYTMTPSLTSSSSHTSLLAHAYLERHTQSSGTSQTAHLHALKQLTLLKLPTALAHAPQSTCSDLNQLLESCNSGSTLELLELQSWMERWLQRMCCALAVVLVPYFGDVGGRLRKREDEELF